MKKGIIIGSIIGYITKLLLMVYIFACWIINIVQLAQCDFASPYKDEVIHILGVIIPPAAGITIWL